MLLILVVLLFPTASSSTAARESLNFRVKDKVLKSGSRIYADKDIYIYIYIYNLETTRNKNKYIPKSTYNKMSATHSTQQNNNLNVKLAEFNCLTSSLNFKL